jgi:hypothetical protein
MTTSPNLEKTPFLLWRERLKLSTSEAAKRLGKSTVTIWHLDKGNHKPTRSTRILMDFIEREMQVSRCNS